MSESTEREQLQQAKQAEIVLHEEHACKEDLLEEVVREVRKELILAALPDDLEKVWQLRPSLCPCGQGAPRRSTGS